MNLEQPLIGPAARTLASLRALAASGNAPKEFPYQEQAWPYRWQTSDGKWFASRTDATAYKPTVEQQIAVAHHNGGLHYENCPCDSCASARRTPQEQNTQLLKAIFGKEATQ